MDARGVEVYCKAEENGDLWYAECMGNMMKNCIALHRLTADILNFAKRYKGGLPSSGGEDPLNGKMTYYLV